MLPHMTNVVSFMAKELYEKSHHSKDHKIISEIEQYYCSLIVN